MPSVESEQIRTFVKNEMAPLFTAETPVETMRQNLEAMLAQVQLAPEVQVEKVTVAGRPAEWVNTPGVARDRALLYLHGGGYVIGSCEAYRDLASRLSHATGLRVLVIEYRLAPEYPFPAALQDAIAAYRWLGACGIKPEDIVVSGDSAGGGLAVATLLSLRDAGDVLPAAAVLLSPWTDLEETGASMTTRAAFDPLVSPKLLVANARHYAGQADRRHPLLSPIYADLDGLPPLLIHVGSDEVLLDDSLRLAERARAAGVEVTLQIWEGMWHVFQLFAATLPEGQQARDQIGDYIGRCLHLP